MNHLDGDWAVEALVAGGVDDAHATLTEFSFDSIMAYGPADHLLLLNTVISTLLVAMSRKHQAHCTARHRPLVILVTHRTRSPLLKAWWSTTRKKQSPLEVFAPVHALDAGR